MNSTFAYVQFPPQETLGECKMCTQLNGVVKEKTRHICRSQISTSFHMSLRHLFTSEVTTFPPNSDKPISSFNNNSQAENILMFTATSKFQVSFFKI